MKKKGRDNNHRQDLWQMRAHRRPKSKEAQENYNRCCLSEMDRKKLKN